MSVLSVECKRLRDRADELRMLASGMDAPYIVPSTKLTMALAMQSAAFEMREAADTIESLRDRLQESERHYRINLEVMGEMCHPEIVELMQECHATQANYEHCKYSTDRGWCDTSKYAELFGTPERAARTLADNCDDHNLCNGCPADCERHDCYDALLEWMRGDK
ncbi:MAG: hypothetical protein IJ087_01435 [Eggerthellaceae bacterium]|nr:hypothetical protein [Eggerthellaceae bacterium]